MRCRAQEPQPWMDAQPWTLAWKLKLANVLLSAQFTVERDKFIVQPHLCPMDVPNLTLALMLQLVALPCKMFKLNWNKDFGQNQTKKSLKHFDLTILCHCGHQLNGRSKQLCSYASRWGALLSNYVHFHCTPGRKFKTVAFFLHHFSLELRAALSFVERLLVLFFIANASLEEPNIFPRKEFLGQQNDAGLKEWGTTTLNPALSSSSTWPINSYILCNKVQAQVMHLYKVMYTKYAIYY